MLFRSFCDHTLALRLASRVITEQPFAPISPAALEQVRESLNHVRILVLCPTAIGPGNLALIEEAVSAAQRGLPIIVLTSPDSVGAVPCACPPDGGKSLSPQLISNIAACDYTGGKGLECMTTLLQTGAIVATSVSESLDVIRQKCQ